MAKVHERTHALVDNYKGGCPSDYHFPGAQVLPALRSFCWEGEAKAKLSLIEIGLEVPDVARFCLSGENI